MIGQQVPACRCTVIRISFLHSPEEGIPDRLRSDWDRLIEKTENRLALFQSPEWFDHLRAMSPGTPASLACIRDGDGTLVGVVPFFTHRLELPYSVRRVRLWKGFLSVLEIPGGTPLVPDDGTVYDQLFGTLRDAARCIDGLYLHMVPTSGYCWCHANASPVVRNAFRLCVPDGVTLNHSTKLPGTFEEYLLQFGSKTRSNLRRKVRLLREHGGGKLELRRFEGKGEVPAFLEAAVPVAKKSWQGRSTDDRIDATPYWHAKFGDLADRGLLRAYVLSAGSVDCAFAVGYQGRGVFHHFQTGYDTSFSKFSPGAVLHYLLYEDLILHNPPRGTCFGFGDGDYKRDFANTHSEEVSFLLLNRRLSSTIKVGVYTSFQCLIRVAKGLVRARKSGPIASPTH